MDHPHQETLVRRIGRSWLATGCLAIACLVVDTTSLSGQESWLQGLFARRPEIASRDSAAMMRLVRPLSERVDQSVIQVFSGGRIVALGTIVSADGYAVTKYSELSAAPISVRVPSGKKVPARVSAVRPANDLALLKLDGSEPETWDIKPANFASVEPPTGSFVITPDRDGYALGLGTLGVRARHVGHRGRLGVTFYDGSTEPPIVQTVYPSSGASDAGLQDGDRILKINGQQMSGSKSAITTLGRFYPGEVVKLTIMRGDDTLELDARMRDQTVLMESQNDAKVNGPRNARLSGFDQVIQHDTVLAPNQCGGPILDSDGNIIGVNIARAGRVVTYALPSALVNAEMVSMLDEARRQ
ncbi:S1C family serine protease [Roseiconus lacunae]|uniref:S1C family serine protease n=1 Tax=Roseiconus lacunae TaxID=2605694 RepID=UPI001E3BCCE6|nr:S1C family serine protease [Roseiconus lacunae]MCD0463379.1 PDZ domain-containing protein [Roseiconus lacunae]WRQ48503.1 S1C family serine protease [Stieleria sp. HD01]